VTVAVGGRGVGRTSAIETLTDDPVLSCDGGKRKGAFRRKM
jgi:hypothetical protein